MKRIAVVVQRYGSEINGGAELHARLLVRALKPYYDIEVLTTCAKDYVTWDTYYPPGECTVEDVKVLRFPHPQRNHDGRARIPRPHRRRWRHKKLYSWLGARPVALPKGNGRFDGEEFIRLQGPYSAALIEHLEASRHTYDAVIFMTALYHPTAAGIRRWGPRSILVPTLHDEMAMYLPLFHQVFHSAGWIMYNTAAEKRLAGHLYGQDLPSGEICGLGIDVAPADTALLQALRHRLGISGDYLIYVGRIDPAKGCDQLIAAFRALAARHPEAQLVMVGQAFMQVEPHPQIKLTGFISDAERNALVAGASALVIPSQYESLSMVLLESLLLGTPVIANGACEVLKDHIEASGAGMAYAMPQDLESALSSMLNLEPGTRLKMALSGQDYVKNNYQWDRVIAKFTAAIDHVGRLPER